jgi:hypothetical protein
VREFTNGYVYYSAATGAWDVQQPVLTRYVALGGATGALGLPTAAAATIAGRPDAVVQPFTAGDVLSSPATGAYAVPAGGFLRRYLATGGAATSYLGLPTSDVVDVAGGRRQTYEWGTMRYDAASNRMSVDAVWRASVQTVVAAQVPYTYRPGCPVRPSALRSISMPYYDWSGNPRLGTLVARSTVVADLQQVFHKAFVARFPIRRIDPVDVWNGSDVRAMAADNTSAFNCRKVTGNPYRLSQHSYGNAIDINTLENPYVTPSRVYPAAGRAFLARAHSRRGMILRDGPIARAMRRAGWQWGARWAHPDYQHFSSNGG